MDKNLNLHTGAIIGDWVVCSSSSDTMTLFSLKDQAKGDWNNANEFCSNFNTSPLNGWVVTSSKLPSQSDFENVVSQTGMSASSLANGNIFWLSDYDDDGFFCRVNSVGSIIDTYYASHSYGVHPLITITLIK